MENSEKARARSASDSGEGKDKKEEPKKQERRGPQNSGPQRNWLENRQIYVQIYISLCRWRAGLGLGKSTLFYMDLPVL